MPNKRFLGLGFTFSATDNGLEKKLLGISSALSGIADALKSVSSEADSASSSIGSISAPSSSRAGKRLTPKSKDSSTAIISGLTEINKSVHTGFASVLKEMSKTRAVIKKIPQPDFTDLSVGFEKGLSSLSKSVDRGFASTIKELGSLAREPKEGKPIVVTVEQPTKKEKLSPSGGVGDLSNSLVTLNKSVDKGFSSVLKEMESGAKSFDSHMKANTSFLGDVIAAIEQNKVDIILPDKQSKDLLKITKAFKKQTGKDFTVVKATLGKSLTVERKIRDLLSQVKTSLEKCSSKKEENVNEGFTKKEEKQTKDDSTFYESKFNKFSDTLYRPYSEAGSKFSSDTKGIFDKIYDSVKETFGENIASGYLKQIANVKIALDKDGNASKESVEKIFSFAIAMSDTAVAMSKFTKSFTLLHKAMEMAKHWFSEVKSASERFFLSVGVDFGKMIPEQFKALYGVIDAAILKPIKNTMAGIGKFVFGKIVKSKQEVILGKISKALGTNLSKNETVQAYLSRIDKNTQKEKGMGMLDWLAVLLAPLALLAGFVAGFYKEIKLVIAAFKELKVVKWIGKGFENLYKYLKEIPLVKKAIYALDWAYTWAGVKVIEFGEWIGKGIKAFKEIPLVKKAIYALDWAYTWAGVKLIDIGESIGKAISWFKDLEIIKGIVKVFKGVVDSPVFGKLFKWGLKLGGFAGKFVPYLGLAFIAFDIISGVIEAFEKGGKWYEIAINAVLFSLDNILMNIPSALYNVGKTYFKSVSEWFKELPGKLSDLLMTYGPMIANAFLTTLGPIGWAAKRVIKVMKGVSESKEWTSFKGTIGETFSLLGTYIKYKTIDIFNSVKKWVVESAKDAGNFISSAWDFTKKKTLSSWRGFQDTLSTAWTGLINGLKNAGALIADMVPQSWKDSLSKAADKFTELFQWVIDKIKAMLPSWETVKEKAASAVAPIKNVWTGLKDWISNSSDSIWDSATKGATAFTGTMDNIGKDFNKSLKAGIAESPAYQKDVMNQKLLADQNTLAQKTLEMQKKQFSSDQKSNVLDLRPKLDKKREQDLSKQRFEPSQIIDPKSLDNVMLGNEKIVTGFKRDLKWITKSFEGQNVIAIKTQGDLAKVFGFKHDSPTEANEQMIKAIEGFNKTAQEAAVLQAASDLIQKYGKDSEELKAYLEKDAELKKNTVSRGPDIPGQVDHTKVLQSSLEMLSKASSNEEMRRILQEQLRVAEQQLQQNQAIIEAIQKGGSSNGPLQVNIKTERDSGLKSQMMLLNRAGGT